MTFELIAGKRSLLLYTRSGPLPGREGRARELTQAPKSHGAGVRPPGFDLSSSLLGR